MLKRKLLIVLPLICMICVAGFFDFSDYKFVASNNLAKETPIVIVDAGHVELTNTINEVGILS